MNLALDIGNTRTKIGIFQGKKLTERAVWTNWTMPELLDYGNQAGVKRVIICSVAQPNAAIAKGLTGHFEWLELAADTPLPFQNHYGTPHTLGKDRLAAIAGAQALWPGEHCLVIDCGTCIKYDLITAESVFPGGNIAPGLRMRIQAMHHFTARLPEVPTLMPPDFVGNSTESALQNGALRGAVLEIEGFVQLFRQRTGSLQVVLTGGDAAFLQPYLNIPVLKIEPDLTLFGLNNILEYNTL